MGELIDLTARRRQRDAAKAFAQWPRRLGCAPAPGDGLCDLPDQVLNRLAELSPESTLAIYDLVLGVRGLGPGERFTYLESQQKVQALDTFLFLADQVRFELMRRLGWVEATAGEEYDLLTLAREPERIRSRPGGPLPRLTSGYPDFAEVERRLQVEPAAVIHSLIPKALQAFRRRMGQGGGPGPGA